MKLNDDFGDFRDKRSPWRRQIRETVNANQPIDPKVHRAESHSAHQEQTPNRELELGTFEEVNGKPEMIPNKTNKSRTKEPRPF